MGLVFCLSMLSSLGSGIGSMGMYLKKWVGISTDNTNTNNNTNNVDSHNVDENKIINEITVNIIEDKKSSQNDSTKERLIDDLIKLEKQETKIQEILDDILIHEKK
jgi:hypothetical protein